ncbi:MAG: class I SAM-dependent rRNA methyltransferase, partial [Saprospiraceae bacterium]|nr:class I SAM-dependent rRNA methyltransferase [Saprospiraceae bacterium]
KRATEVEKAISQYQRLAEHAVSLLAKGGMLVLASCSSRVTADQFFETIESVLEGSGRQLICVEKTFHDADHPIGFPEGAYLKTGYYEETIGGW